MSERCETDKTPQAKANATDKFNSIARHNQRHCLFNNAATTNQAIFSAIFNSLLEHLHEQSVQQHSEHSRSIVDRIRPAVEHLLESDDPLDPAELCESAVRANVNASVAQLQHESGMLKRLIDEKEMRIVGAEYSLETGVVEFFESENASQLV